MEIEFDRTIDDVIEFNLVSVDNSPSIGRQLFLQRLVISIIVFAAIPFSIYVVGDRHLQITDYIIGAVLGGFVFFVHPSINRFDYIRRLRKFYAEGDSKALFGRHKYIFSQEGIIATTQAGESRINWSSINKIIKNKKYIFLFLGTGHAITIPRNAFVDIESEKSFLDIVHAYTGK